MSKNKYNFVYKEFKRRNKYLISDLKDDISAFKKKVDCLCLNVEIDNINQYGEMRYNIQEI